MQEMRGHLKNVSSVLVQYFFEAHHTIDCMYPQLDHHQEEQFPLPYLDLALLEDG